MTPSATARSDLLELLRNRSSVRDFYETPVEPELVDAVIAAARQAPTSSNLQACSIVVVRDADSKKRLSVLAGNQRHIVVAPVLLALCADVSRLSRIAAQNGLPFAADTLEMLLVASLDAGLIGMCASIAAESLGLGSVMIGGLRNDPEAVADILGLPPQVYVVFGLCIGWPASRPAPKPRLPTELAVHAERYGDQPIAEAVERYSGALAPAGAVDPWHLRVAKEMAHPKRATLGDALRRRGFRF
jgi:nitroreductase